MGCVFLLHPTVLSEPAMHCELMVQDSSMNAYDIAMTCAFGGVKYPGFNIF